MQFVTRRWFALFLALACLIPALEARQLPTAISTDNDALHDETIAVCTPVTKGKGNFFTNVLGKALNLPKTVKIEDLGFQFMALSMEAFQATPADPKSPVVVKNLPYLKASKEIQDSMKLRRTARQIRAQLMAELLKKADQLNDEQKKALNSFLTQSVGAPVIILDKSPLPSFMPTPGPCMIPIGIERVEAGTEKRIGLETSAICLLDIPGVFSVSEAQANDTLDIVLAHENAHAIQFDMMGKGFQLINRPSTNGHDAPIISDLGLAYTEGWAEAFEAVYGPANPKFKEKDRKKFNISEFLYARQDPIRRERYVWSKVGGKQTGLAKNGLQLMSTEGVIAGLFYDILTSRKITAPFEKCVSVMLMQQPKNFPEFVLSYLRMFKDDRAVVLRIVLENTHYSVCSNEARKAYQAWYLARTAYQQKKGSQEDASKAEKAYRTLKEELFAKAYKSDAEIFTAVGPDLWFSGEVKLEKKISALDVKAQIMKKLGQDPDVFKFNLNLNTINRGMLKFIGVAEADADMIVTK
ncbi:MAG TPA: hypothetical protein PKO06_18680, partial [Candidatus Ozemobacteraceae bacterium]|nr:hypothetical protein [Candidatus Ozemobacteraceae bacterium]